MKTFFASVFIALILSNKAAALAPTVTTNAATNVTATSATLNGTVNPNGLLTNVYFQYGTSTNYTNTTGTANVNGNSPLPIYWNLSALTPNTTYHYRIDAGNSSGGAYGNDVVFTTSNSTASLTITSTAFDPPTATVGIGYGALTPVMATGGQTPYSWSATGLPNGMSISSSTGALFGIPTTAGNFNVAVTVRDSSNPQQTASKTLPLTVNNSTASLTITSTAFDPPTATVGIGYGALTPVMATGGQTPYSWSATGLPNGMSISSSTGALFGIPTTAGNFNVTVTVHDSSNPHQTASKTLPLTVNDTTASPPPLAAVISVHPASLSIIANPNDDVDVALTLRPSESLLKTTTPSILGGLVADGVTPLLIQIDPSSTPSQPTAFQIRATVTGGSLRTGALSENFHVLQQASTGQTVFAVGNTVVLSPAHPTGFAYVHGIKSEDIQLASGSKELSVTLSLAQAGYSPTSTVHFAIRRPPIVLVHGYRANRDTWGPNFLSTLYETNAPDFVIRVEYGVSRSDGYPNEDENMFGTLTYLASVLDTALRDQVEQPLRDEWAMTRYDVVGHSQGGVLARMLSTNRQPYFTTPFRSAANSNRGRFHRIVTIGSPHNGSTYVYYLERLDDSIEGFLFEPVAQALRQLGILQPKFDPPFGTGTQLDEINAANGNWSVDPTAKFHLIAATIYGGQAPLYSQNPFTVLAEPLSYRISRLCEGISLFGLGGPSRGSVVLPQGSDGVVDLKSQLGGGGGITPFDNVSATLVVDIAHADASLFGAELFGVGNGCFETQYQGVAFDVKTLLAGPVEGNFGSFRLQAVPASLQNDIDSVIPHLFPGGTISPVGTAIHTSRNSTTTQSAASSLTFQFHVIAAAGELVSTPPTWYAQVFGPNGVSPSEAMVLVNPSDPTNVSVTVDNTVKGDVVLYESYQSQSGKVIVANPVIVLSRPPGAALVGIELVPAAVNLSAGSHVSSEVWADFDNRTRSRIYFPIGSNPRYVSSKPSVATVDASGEIVLKSAGRAVVTASYAGFSAHSSLAVVAEAPHPTSPTALGNISTRLNVETGENVLIGGFIITGSQPKRVMIRGIGPSLTAFGVSGALADPTLELHNSSGQVIANNNDWGTSTNRQSILATGIAPANAKESAILMSLNPGQYTAIVRGVNNTTGVALVEAYDLDQTVPSKLGNISTRGFVKTGDSVMIGGLIVISNDPTRIILRAIGPSLSQFGIASPLIDPILELHDKNGALIASNDNWKSSQQAEIQATGIAPKDNRESAIVKTLAPGSYTAIVRGKNNMTGVALVEAYQLDN